MGTITDGELVAETLAGSADAYRELVERFQRPVLSLIVRMVHDPTQAEDLAQEVFLKAFRKLRLYDPGRKFSSWLFKIAHNTTIDHLRRKVPETVPLEASADGDEGTWEVLRSPEEEAPDRRAEQAEATAGVLAAIDSLKPQYREVLLLRFQQDLSYLEISEVTGLAMGTVKIHLHRARKQLASALAAAGRKPPGRFSEKSRPAAKQAATRPRRGPRGERG